MQRLLTAADDEKVDPRGSSFMATIAPFSKSSA